MAIRNVLRASPWSARAPRNVAESAAPEGGTGVRVCVMGPGTRFLSGLTVYTVRLANALAQTHQVSVLLMRQLLPTQLYPGADRVGNDLARLQFHPQVRVFDGVDWYWIPSILRAVAFLLRERPHVTIFQWWTGTVAHSYIILACLARMLGARVVIEFHEVQDPGELRIRVARAYVRLVAPLLMRLASGFAVHAEADRALLEQRYPLGARPVAIMPHGPHDHYQACDTGEEGRVAPDSACNLLFFGLIRPYKGLQDLIAAFHSLSPQQAAQFWLTIVGETWEGWTLPAELVAQSPYRERITFVNRYVDDEEVGKFFRAADAVILPYHRSCISGPLHVAMGYGLPVVVTRVGGMAETVEGYDGAILIPPQDSSALKDALVRVAALRGKRFTHPHTWDHTATAYIGLLSELMDNRDARPEHMEEARV